MVIRVFIIDDHAIFSEGLELLLSAEKDIEVIESAISGSDAVKR